jgi:hypothetical protein
LTHLSKIKILLSKSFAQIYIFVVTMWVWKIKGKNRSSRYQVGPLNVWTFMKFIPGLHTTWHMCVFHDQCKLTNDVLHTALCVDIIRFPLEFSFEFIWIFIRILSENIKCICTRCETGQKNSSKSSVSTYCLSSKQ